MNAEEWEEWLAEPRNWPEPDNWPEEWRKWYYANRDAYLDFAHLMGELDDKNLNGVFEEVLVELGYEVFEKPNGKKRDTFSGQRIGLFDSANRVDSAGAREPRQIRGIVGVGTPNAGLRSVVSPRLGLQEAGSIKVYLIASNSCICCVEWTDRQRVLHGSSGTGAPLIYLARARTPAPV